MEKKSSDDITALTPEGNIRRCPVCGYNDGFHVSFQFDDNSKQGSVILICPDCHSRFDMGWKVVID